MISLRTKVCVYSFILTNALDTFSVSQAGVPEVQAEEIKIALIGDTGAGSNFGAVLKLIADEQANVVMINGDFGYGAAPEAWRDRVTSSIDINSLSVIGSLGNHDVEDNNTNQYISILNSFRTKQNGLTKACTGKSAVTEGRDIIAADEVCTFGNVSVIASGIGQVLSASYLENRLEKKLKDAPLENWKLVGYHYTLASMNPGIKSDQSTHRFFDTIRKYGAIGAQGHTHSAMATCPISSSFLKGNKLPECHPEFSNIEERFVLPGTGIYIDSSLGGKDYRKRGRCKNPNEQGCQHMIDIISKEGYTRADGITKTDFNRYGALFMTFNKGGDPTKAEAFYKSIDGKIVFKFNISR